ncbi:MFS transporter [Aquipuribacter nitratireducens]|uniref:MFS transporter n=1 Tax=Aquipuribacter nitratireducens TaxID=650104 RepID=A0ABW0GL50_9MICO
MSTAPGVGPPDLAGARPRVPHRRQVVVLSAAQVAIGVGVAVGIAAGSLLAQDVAGSTSLAGLLQTAAVLGAALLAVPLARLAARRGRRTALVAGLGLAVAGALGTVGAAVIGSFALLLPAAGLFGAGTAVGLQARFAATDGVVAESRGRALSTVVWATTVGAVAGPNLAGPAGALDRGLGLPAYSGAYVLSAVAFAAAAGVLAVGLPRHRPGEEVLAAPRDGAGDRVGDRSGSSTVAVLRAVWHVPEARLGVVAVAAAHAVMVGVMVMTPVHLGGHGASLQVVGFVISGHIAGMYAASPLFGWLADRAGPRAGIGTGLALLVAALVVAGGGGAVGDGPLGHGAVGAGLVLLSLGWSSCLVAGSAALARAFDGDDPRARTLQGASDLVMGVAGAGAGAVSGPVLALLGYPGLVVVAAAPLAAVAVLLARRPGAPDLAPYSAAP